MDFFEQQDQARRKTKTLVLYFVLAVIGIVGSIYLVVITANGWLGISSVDGTAAPWKWWRPDLLGGTAVATLTVILLGTGFKTLQLNAGGSVVALDLGGRRLDPGTNDLDERRLLNIVEEMAIASGMPVPEVYLLEGDEGINAFAAGRSPGDAVIGVTRGCMKMLSRDELQGVIAHEFSHILNGDMRLNLRLVGLLFGILVLAIMGRILMRVGAQSRRNGFPLVCAGLAVWIIGSMGVLFGRLIQAAISRQREFLADASAVQFTRNPGGIGGALKKIGGLIHGSLLTSPRAAEASHMLFANGLRGGMTSIFATHPPLPERIRAIDPYWDGIFPKVALPEISEGWERGSEHGRRPRPPDRVPPPLPQRGAVMGFSPSEAAKSVGRLDSDHLEEGRMIREQIPGEWLEALHHPAGAQALIFALLLARDEELRARETAFLEKATDFVTLGETLRLHGEIGNLHSSRKLALIDLAMPALRRLSPDEYLRLRNIMAHLIESDGILNLFEFTLQKIVLRHLDGNFLRLPPPRIEFRALDALADDVAGLLSTLSILGHPEDESAADAAFRSGAEEIEAGLRTGGPLLRKPRAELSLDRIDAALDRLNRATPLLKKQLLNACGRTVMADGRIQSDQAELLRAMADTIGCAIPPFVRVKNAIREDTPGYEKGMRTRTQWEPESSRG